MKRRDEFDEIADRVNEILDKHGDPPPNTDGETCDNCRAYVPDGCGRDFKGRKICCVHCIFDPEGCRCKYGQYGVPMRGRFDDITW